MFEESKKTVLRGPWEQSALESGHGYELEDPTSTLKTVLAVLRSNLHTFDRNKVQSYLDQLLSEVGRLEQRLSAANGMAAKGASFLEVVGPGPVSHSRAVPRVAADTNLDEIAGRVVLVVDDEPTFARMLADGLAEELPFVDVLVAHDGQEALDLMKRCPIDLVITDVEMPVLDGMSLVAEMVNRGIHKPVVMMTARGSSRDIELDARRHGVISVLDKPIDFNMLVETCTGTLRSWSRGAIEGVTLAGLLQLLEMERRTCTVRVFGGVEQGIVAIAEGEIVACSALGHRGIEALCEIVSWPSPRIELCPLGDYERTEEPIPLRVALLEGARRSDETHRDELAGPTRLTLAPKPKAARDGCRIVMRQLVDAGMEELTGSIAFAIVDERTGACLAARAKDGFPIERAALGNADVVSTKRRVIGELGHDELEDMVITLANQYHVIVPTKGPSFLYMVLDRSECNLSLTRHWLMQLAQSLQL